MNHRAFEGALMVARVQIDGIKEHEDQAFVEDACVEDAFGEPIVGPKRPDGATITSIVSLNVTLAGCAHVRGRSTRTMNSRFAVGAVAGGAAAVGAIAVGALAVGAVSIGKLLIRRGTVQHLRIDELTVGELRVERLVISERAPAEPL